MNNIKLRIHRIGVNRVTTQQEDLDQFEKEALKPLPITLKRASQPFDWNALRRHSQTRPTRMSSNLKNRLRRTESVPALRSIHTRQCIIKRFIARKQEQESAQRERRERKTNLDVWKEKIMETRNLQVIHSERLDATEEAEFAEMYDAFRKASPDFTTGMSMVNPQEGPQVDPQADSQTVPKGRLALLMHDPSMLTDFTYEQRQKAIEKVLFFLAVTAVKR